MADYAKRRHTDPGDYRFAGRIPTQGGEISITFSVGVAGAESGATVDAMVAAADGALYRAKSEGRNQAGYIAENQGSDYEKQTNLGFNC